MPLDHIFISVSIVEKKVQENRIFLLRNENSFVSENPLDCPDGKHWGKYIYLAGIHFGDMK